MKITLTNIEYSEDYKAVAVNASPKELMVEIPDNTFEHQINAVVFGAIAKKYSPYMAQNIEKAEFTIL